MNGGLLVAGTTSDAGKSVVTAGICRWLVRQGVKVAPFKAQNMSLNSFVTREGAEIGRAQAMQAQACRVEPTAHMNPVLLKPGGERSSQVVLLGRPVGEMSARGYHGGRQERLLGTVLDSLAELRGTYDAVICEGAGSPAEINLRRTDIVNMGIARGAGLPVLVVGDIDRGGVFASFFGTVALLAPEDQALVAGFLVNKFRGDVSLLEPGLEMLHGLTGRRTYGVLPFRHGLGIDEEDGMGVPPRERSRAWGSVSLRGTVRESVVAPPVGEDVLRVAVCAVPLMSNFTDVDALAAEPGVVVRFVDRPEELADADLVIVPGTRGTVRALQWLRERGLADAIARRAADGRPVLGICGGFQLLGEHIEDEVESRAGHVDGLGLLPVRVRFAREKTLTRPVGEALGERVEGYEIHHGVAEVLDGEPFLDGCRTGQTWGTHWHGSLESDGFRRAFLREVAAAAGRRFVPAPTHRSPRCARSSSTGSAT
ncbi:cobyric acid synthase [Streptomyces violaceorubidus]